jgi:hypothetical protein
MDCVKLEGSIIFKDIKVFRQTIIGETSLDDEMKVGNIEFTGNIERLEPVKELLQRKSSTHATISNAEIPIREARMISADGSPPIKAGWLLKKRDIISGWKCRYFEVYKDRLDYYADQNDSKPRGSYILDNAELSNVKQLRIKRRSEHYGFM